MSAIHQSAPLDLSPTVNTRLLKLELEQKLKRCRGCVECDDWMEYFASSPDICPPCTCDAWEDYFDSIPDLWKTCASCNPSAIKRKGHYLPNTPQSMISIQLCVISLEDAPSYTAVSYVWGDPSPTKPILLDGQPFTVRQNLWDLLNQLRDVDFDGYLWIDALSIDQTSNSEKNHQVAIMGSIYKQARTTIAWLGTASMEVEEQVHALKTEFSVLRSFDSQGQRPVIIDRLPKAGFKYIFAHPYWTRTWILQEYFLSSSVEFWCGNEVLSDSELVSKVNDLFDSVDVSLADIFDAGAHETTLRMIQFSTRSASRTFSLIWLLELSAYHLCIDPRDRIYALLSLISPRERELWGITPDYAASTQDLFEHLCRVFQNTDLNVERWAWNLEEWKEWLRRILLLNTVEEDRQDKTYVSDVVETRPRDHRASRLREKSKAFLSILGIRSSNVHH